MVNVGFVCRVCRLKRLLLLLFIVTLPGCSSVGWLIHHNPPASDLYVTDEEVAECIAELSVEPQDNNAVVYNPDTDRYEIRPDAYAKALKDGIMYRLTKEKIAKFTADYKEDKLSTALKRDAGTSLFAIIIGLVATILLF